MSSRTNSFSGDRLLIAIASPKLSSVARLFFVIAAKHLSLKDWLHSKTWSQSCRSPAKRSLTCPKQRQMSPEQCYTITADLREGNYLQQFAWNESSSLFWTPKFPTAFSALHLCSVFQHPSSSNLILKLKNELRCTMRICFTKPLCQVQLYASLSTHHMGTQKQEKFFFAYQ